MKIYGDQSFLLDRLSVRSQHRANALQGSSKIAEFADRFIEEQQALSKDQMTVSKEGLDYIRQQLFKLETEDGKNQTLGTKPIDKLCSTYIILYSDVVSEDGVSRNLHMDLMKQYRREMAGKKIQTGHPIWTVFRRLMPPYAGRLRKDMKMVRETCGYVITVQERILRA